MTLKRWLIAGIFLYAAANLLDAFTTYRFIQWLGFGVEAEKNPFVKWFILTFGLVHGLIIHFIINLLYLFFNLIVIYFSARLISLFSFVPKKSALIACIIMTYFSTALILVVALHNIYHFLPAKQISSFLWGWLS